MRFNVIDDGRTPIIALRETRSVIRQTRSISTVLGTVVVPFALTSTLAAIAYWLNFKDFALGLSCLALFGTSIAYFGFPFFVRLCTVDRVGGFVSLTGPALKIPIKSIVATEVLELVSDEEPNQYQLRFIFRDNNQESSTIVYTSTIEQRVGKLARRYAQFLNVPLRHELRRRSA